MHLFCHAVLHLGNISQVAMLIVETINGSGGSANHFGPSTESGQHLFGFSFEKLRVEHFLQRAEKCTSSHLPQYFCLMNGLGEFRGVSFRMERLCLEPLEMSGSPFLQVDELLCFFLNLFN